MHACSLLKSKGVFLEGEPPGTLLEMKSWLKCGADLFLWCFAVAGKQVPARGDIFCFTGELRATWQKPDYVRWHGWTWICFSRHFLTLISWFICVSWHTINEVWCRVMVVILNHILVALFLHFRDRKPNKRRSKQEKKIMLPEEIQVRKSRKFSQNELIMIMS